MPQIQSNSPENPKVKFAQTVPLQSERVSEKVKISKKYFLNKPKIIKDFQNSKLFHNSLNTYSLKQYSPRYTYNQKVKHFQKQNPLFIQSQYQINYSLIENLHKEKSTQIPKLIQLNKKSQKLHSQKTQKSIQTLDPTQKSHTSNQFSEKKLQKNQPKIYEKQNKQKSILRKISEKRIKTSNHNLHDIFSNKPRKQTIKKYISMNPINYTPLKIDTLKEKFNFNTNFYIPTQRKRTVRFQSYQPTQSFSNKKANKSFKNLENKDSRNEEEIQCKKYDLFKCLQQETERLYEIIKQLRNLGYAEEKVNEWLWAFCENNKKFLQSILFKTQGYRSSLAELKLIYKLQEMQTAKLNAKKYKRIINSQEIPLQPSDISDMTNYLEQILISKQYFELKRLQNQIQDTSYAIKNNYNEMQDEKGEDIMKLITNFQNKKKLKPMEYYQTLNFYEDAKRLETHFGKIKGLTTAKKRKCENLTQVEIDILRNKK